MTLTFKKITLHNFGSYGDAEVVLENKGFCLVSGKNNCSSDNALSNGAGKSFLWSAICYTLTGETINGLKANLKNINISEDSCYTVLDFTVDKDDYQLTRIHKPKSDLKIIKNGTDISGKGIRESEQKLTALLPDLTKDLIASTILIGQGMPNKFSSFSPAGRKEMLEKLTKSDFMIEDIKTRLNQRMTELTQQIRVQEDSLLVQATQLTTKQASLEQLNADIASYKPIDYQQELLAQYEALNNTTAALEQLTEQLQINADAQDQAAKKANDIQAEKTKLSDEETKNYIEARNIVADKQSKKQTEIDSLQKEINKLKAIKDVCPTCGQKLIGVQKPDTTVQQQQLTVLQAELTRIQIEEVASVEHKHTEYRAQIDQQFAEALNEQQTLAAKLKTVVAEMQKQQLTLLTTKQGIENKINQIQFSQQNEQKLLESWQAKKQALEQEITQTETLITLCKTAKQDLLAHSDVVKKIETLIKRDFRGYLLSNVISFIDAKVKEYAQIVFDNTNLNVYLDGNSLEIMYCDKYFDNLSGGEKQRVDLILQFAIRDMLSTYLNYSSNIIVLDEVFDNLDKIATDKILTLITEELKDIDSIFIISHHTDTLNIGYDSELTIVKNPQGISEVVN